MSIAKKSPCKTKSKSACLRLLYGTIMNDIKHMHKVFLFPQEIKLYSAVCEVPIIVAACKREQVRGKKNL